MSSKAKENFMKASGNLHYIGWIFVSIALGWVGWIPYVPWTFFEGFVFTMLIGIFGVLTDIYQKVRLDYWLKISLHGKSYQDKLMKKWHS